MNLKINNNARYDVLGIGSALLDFTLNCDEGLLAKLGLKKGEMHLIDEGRSREILSMLEGEPMEITPGGSSANTIAGILNFNGKAAFNGKVGRDRHGDLYISETEKTGAAANIRRGTGASGHAITFITPDSERTFATHLGASLQFTGDDVDVEGIRMSKILHLEGYLFEPPVLRNACIKAMKAAKENSVLVSIDLSDPALIGRIHDTFQDALSSYADIVFVNEDEAKAFTGKENEDALEKLSKLCPFAVVKLGSKGSLIRSEGETFSIAAFKANVVNTNGAGDMYAAGVLYGISKGMGPERCGILGSYGASLVVSRAGARINERIDGDKIGQ